MFSNKHQPTTYFCAKIKIMLKRRHSYMFLSHLKTEFIALNVVELQNKPFTPFERNAHGRGALEIHEISGVTAV